MRFKNYNYIRGAYYMKRYSIHSVAELLGISADAIRLYEKEGLVSPMRDE